LVYKILIVRGIVVYKILIPECLVYENVKNTKSRLEVGYLLQTIIRESRMSNWIVVETLCQLLFSVCRFCKPDVNK